MNRILFYINLGCAMSNTAFIAIGAGNVVTVLSLGLNCLAMFLLRKSI